MTETLNGSGDKTELESKIIRQVEYYFGDQNLLRDKFLQEQVKLDDGWIPLDVLVKFNRMKVLSTDFSSIITALKKSSSKLMEIDEDNNKLRRSTDKPLPDNMEGYKQEVLARTLYIKPFPETLSLDELLEFFKTQGNVENIIMRRKEKKFKGSVFAVFSTTEEAEEYLKKDDVKYQDETLLRELRGDFHKRKNEEYGDIKKQKKEQKSNSTDDKPNDSKAGPKLEEIMRKDSIIKIAGMDATTTREDIKEVLKEFGEIAWVDSKVGDIEAIVRFKNDGEGKLAVDGLEAKSKDGAIIIKNTEVEVTLLQGEDESKYWKVVQESMTEQRNKISKHKRASGRRGGRGGGRGGRFSGPTRRSKRLSNGGENDGARQAKQAKLE